MGGPDGTTQLGALIRLLEPHVGEALATRTCLDALALLADRLPADLIRMFGFECRLADSQASLDLQVSLDREGLCGLLDGTGPGSAIARHPGWAGLARFGAAWADPASVLGATVQTVYLEFDLVQRGADPAVPSVFFSLDGSRARAVRMPELRLLTAVCGLQALLGGVPPAGQMAMLATCLRELPREASVSHLGLMLSRPQPTIRLVFAGLPSEAVLPFLARIRWPGDFAGLERLLSLDVREVDAFTLSLDLDPDGGLLPKAGFECLLMRGDAEGTLETRWRTCLEGLARRSLGTTAKLEGVMAFGGITWLTDPALWPARPRPGSGRPPCFALDRSIHHLKITLGGNGLLEAKAYLAVRPCLPAGARLASSAGPPVPARPAWAPRAAALDRYLQHLKVALGAALERGLAFLATQQDTQGDFSLFRSLTRDMADPQRDCSVFCTSQVLHSFADLASPLVVPLRTRAAEAILRKMEPLGLWRFWPIKLLAVDLDDTACASASLAACWPGPRPNVPIILANQDPQGRFLTWLKQGGDNALDGVANANLDGVVNANVVWYLGECAGTAAAIAWLDDRVRCGQEWASCLYYPDPLSLHYAISRAIRSGVAAWRSLGPLLSARIRFRSLDTGDSPALLRAQALATLCGIGEGACPTALGLAQRLLETQAQDGSWAMHPVWHAGPHPIEPRSRWWGSPAMTTAFCLEALNAFNAMDPG